MHQNTTADKEVEISLCLLLTQFTK